MMRMFHLIMVYISILNKQFSSAAMRDALVQSLIVAEGSVDSALRWFLGLKLIQLEQQKTQLPFIILAKKFKTYTLQGHKRYIKLFELEMNNLCISTLAAT